MMRFQIALMATLVLLFFPIAGCGSGSESTATSQNELDAYLAANPEAAKEAPPAIDDN